MSKTLEALEAEEPDPLALTLGEDAVEMRITLITSDAVETTSSGEVVDIDILSMSSIDSERKADVLNALCQDIFPTKLMLHVEINYGRTKNKSSLC